MTDEQIKASADYMGKRYEEAKTTLKEKLAKQGVELEPFTEIYLNDFYHHGITTGIRAFDENLNGNKEGETTK